MDKEATSTSAIEMGRFDILQEPLPFINKDGCALGQTHRVQLGPSRGGIVLSTKAHLAEIAFDPPPFLVASSKCHLSVSVFL